MKTIKFILIIVVSFVLASSCERSFNPVKKAEKIIKKYDSADEIAEEYCYSDIIFGDIADKEDKCRYYYELEYIQYSFYDASRGKLDYTNICDLLVDLYLGYYYRDGMNVDFNVHTYDEITWETWQDITYIDNKYVDSDFSLNDMTIHAIMSSLSIGYELLEIPEDSRSAELNKIIDLSFKISKEDTEYLDGGSISYVYLGDLFAEYAETMSVIADRAAKYYNDALKYLAWSKSDFYYGSRDFDIIGNRREVLIECIKETANDELGSNALYFDENLKWILSCKKDIEEIAKQKRYDALMTLGMLGLF